MFKLTLAIFLLISAGLVMIFVNNPKDQSESGQIQKEDNQDSKAGKIILTEPPQGKILVTNYHVFQTFNNCGPAALSMALKFYGINKSQQELGQELRPYQNPQGDNDDKSTTLEELAEKGKEFGLVPYHRPAGNFDLIKYFITEDIPIIARTWTKPDEDIGHYRVIKGYDTASNTIIQDDSLQNKNLTYAYSDFERIWEKFNFEFLVLVPKDKVEIAEAILGDLKEEKRAWQKSVEISRSKYLHSPNDATNIFNLSIALYNVGDYEGSAREFEKVENRLPFRALWYQTEPFELYYKLGQYNKVFELTDKVLNNHNRAYSELYLIRGEIYKKQGNLDLARQEFEQAAFYNKNLERAKQALTTVN